MQSGYVKRRASDAEFGSRGLMFISTGSFYVYCADELCMIKFPYDRKIRRPPHQRVPASIS